MDLTAEKVINAPPEHVFDALNDPAILRQAIPGCQSLHKESDSRYAMTVALKVGPLRSTFAGTIAVDNVDRPSGYTLIGEADGGVVGKARGRAHVALAAIDEGTTNLAYHLTAETEGELADLDERIVATTARTLANEFFSRLQLLVESVDAPSMIESLGARDARAAAPQADAPADAPLPAEATTPVDAPAQADAPAAGNETPVAAGEGAKDAPVAPQPAAKVPAASYTEGAVADVPVREEELAERMPRTPSRTLETITTGTASFGQASRDAPVQVSGEADGGQSPMRWVLAAIGALIVILLLSGGF
ncbi:MAG: carbon monoxide dehydrogenase subunit G [Pseudomonadota bacterium]